MSSFDKLMKSVSIPDNLNSFSVLLDYTGKLIIEAEKIYKNGENRKKSIIMLLEYLIIHSSYENKTELIDLINKDISPAIDNIVNISKFINIKSGWCC